MPQFLVRLAMLSMLALIALPGIGAAAAAGQSGQTAPQGEDPPGADSGTPEMPGPSQGVIPPPDIGDEGIHTDVPNPEAGHDEEVIPPPGTQGEPPQP